MKVEDSTRDNPTLRRLAMNRVNMQIALERAIDDARMVVKSKKGLRDAVRVGIYEAGRKVFAATDSTTAYEVKGDKLVQLSQEEYEKYIRPFFSLQASYEFKILSEQELNTLIKLFSEVSKQ
jgi:hypothetical protein